jgi:tRNA(Arg) A34 adenosine deaminase TadA
MYEAIAEAKKAYENGEVPVGAVIVYRKTGTIIARSHNLVEAKNNSLLHAEIIVINRACEVAGQKNLFDCDIYVSLEPCAMCAAAISYARIARLFYAAADLKQGAVENGSRFFTQDSCFHRPEIYPGIAAEVSSELMKSFFRNIRKNGL